MAPRKKVVFRRRKVCKLCVEKVDYVDYKDTRLLQSFVVDRAKILPRRISGACAKHQRIIQQAIKRARHVALMPFVIE